MCIPYLVRSKYYSFQHGIKCENHVKIFSFFVFFSFFQLFLISYQPLSPSRALCPTTITSCYFTAFCYSTDWLLESPCLTWLYWLVSFLVSRNFLDLLVFPMTTSDVSSRRGDSCTIIDFNHPIYIHPFDTQDVQLVSHQLTNHENYVFGVVPCILHY